MYVDESHSMLSQHSVLEKNVIKLDLRTIMSFYYTLLIVAATSENCFSLSITKQPLLY